MKHSIKHSFYVIIKINLRFYLKLFQKSDLFTNNLNRALEMRNDYESVLYYKYWDLIYILLLILILKNLEYLKFSNIIFFVLMIWR